jgi:hypothetical protein
MQVIPSVKPCKIPALASLAVAITTAVIAQSAFSQPAPHQLAFTETSSTSLTATYDGSTSGVSINFISTDHWGVTIGFPVTFSGNPQWTEPEGPSFVNLLTTSGNNQIIVNSDFFPNSTTPLADGSTFTSFGTDTRDGASISVTFHDRGDVAAVADTGSTIGLLSFALTALVGTTRFRSWQLA